MRLATHRSTYAPLVLLNAIIFKDAESVIIFDKFQKLALKSFSIGREHNLEQYQKTPEFISEKLLHIFDSFKETGLCHMCDQVKIKAFNAEALARLKYETDQQPKTPLLITAGTPANTPTDADTPAELH